MLKINFAHFPNLSTERLVLRQLRRNDATEILAIRNNESVNLYLDRPSTTSIEEAEAFIERINIGIKNNSCIYWAITLKNSDNLIGTVCLWNIHIKKCFGEIGYELLPSYQGKGIMYEAVNEVIKFCFESVKFDTITAFTTENNAKSIALLARTGFIPDNDFIFSTQNEANNLTCYFLTKLQNKNFTNNPIKSINLPFNTSK